jgi:hypothetical protein
VVNLCAPVGKSVAHGYPDRTVLAAASASA